MDPRSNRPSTVWSGDGIMALLWADGFDYADPTMNSATNQAEIHEAMSHNNATGENYLSKNYQTGRGGRGLAIGWDSTLGIIRSPRLRDATVNSDFIMGIAINPGNTFRHASNWVQIYVGSDVVMTIRYSTTSDTILFYTGNSSLAAQSPADLIKLNVWQYIEFKIHFDGSVGQVTIRIDGKEVWASAATLDTEWWSTMFWDSVAIQPVNLCFNQALIDDWYICDATGSANNDFLGDVVISAHNPIGDGYLTDWSPSTGSDHYALVDSIPMNDQPDDGTYNATSTVGETEMFTYENLADATPKHATIYGVHTVPFMRITEPVETVGVNNIARRKGVNVDVAANLNNMPPGVANKHHAREFVTYKSQGYMFETEPFNKTRWSIDDVNSTQFGVKHVT